MVGHTKMTTATLLQKGTILCASSELRLAIVLLGGQSFRWRKSPKTDDEFIGVIDSNVWILSQDEHAVSYKVYGAPSVNSSSTDEPKPKRSKPSCQPADDHERTLRNYLRLDDSLESLYKLWGSKDPHFRKICADYTGIRLLNQPSVENLFSFICSANNNIARITSMVENMSKEFGSFIAEIDGLPCHSFPTVARLAEPDVEARLRELKFGYRAKFIAQTARNIEHDHGGAGWLDGLRHLPYPEAKRGLMSLPGVGAKVADCVCLMGLGFESAVPVDTHVWQVANRHYLKHLKIGKTLTTKIYDEIGDHFRRLFGDKAGWAQSVLFAAELKQFKNT